MTSVTRIKPLFYIHVLDNNTNITRVEVGPQTFTRQEHEKIVAGPDAMVMVPPRHYCVVANPAVRGDDNKPVYDRHNNLKLRHGDEEIRFAQDPFPLYPGEKLVGKIAALQVVAPDCALRLRCIRDFVDETAAKTSRHVAGDEWLFRGPGTYTPRVEVQVVEIVRAQVLKENQALRLRARRDCKDCNGVARKAGDEWLVSVAGAYLPECDEEVMQVINARVLTEKKALQLRALRSFKDSAGKQRKAGEEWLVTLKEKETHLPDVDEDIVGEVQLTSLNNRQYCVVVDPVDAATGKQKLGRRELRKGEASFFLSPGERLESGIQSIHILGEDEYLVLRARERFADGKTERAPGQVWNLVGPCEYVPPVEVEIVDKRKAIALDENEGIYVRNRKTGSIVMVTGRTYILEPEEELWEKDLPSIVEDLLQRSVRSPDDHTRAPARDRTRVVTYRAPHNSCVQIYDYKSNKSRIVFGPELVMLGPDEQFTVLSLSGGKPKTANKIKSLCLLLGPDFMTDIVIVETADHARLSLQLSYNWRFDTKTLKSAEEIEKIFAVSDFVGDACKAIASRVRGAVAAASFDAFHKNSAELIKAAVFGSNRDSLRFNANHLVITNIDIQSVEPVDQRTRDSLQKSVQLAIEITTKSQEANARRDAEIAEQKAKGELERQKVKDESVAEAARRKLLELQAQSACVEAAGQAKAEAQARSDARNIEAEAAVKQAELTAEATRIRELQAIEELAQKNKTKSEHQKKMGELEVQRARELAAIESKKFKDIVGAIGAETIRDISMAGPELQAKLLEGLGISSLLITDGSSPINLFGTASGLVANPASK